MSLTDSSGLVLCIIYNNSILGLQYVNELLRLVFFNLAACLPIFFCTKVFLCIYSNAPNVNVTPSRINTCIAFQKYTCEREDKTKRFCCDQHNTIISFQNFYKIRHLNITYYTTLLTHKDGKQMLGLHRKPLYHLVMLYKIIKIHNDY